MEEDNRQATKQAIGDNSWEVMLGDGLKSLSFLAQLLSQSRYFQKRYSIHSWTRLLGFALFGRCQPRRLARGVSAEQVRTVKFRLSILSWFHFGRRGLGFKVLDSSAFGSSPILARQGFLSLGRHQIFSAQAPSDVFSILWPILMQ